MIEFRFAFIPALLLLIPAAIFLFRWWRGLSQSAPPVMRYSDTRLLSGLPAGLRVRLRRLPDVLRLLTWILLVLALARPQSGSGEERIVGQGIDIVMVMDISDSMAESDFNGLTRFDAAKDVIRDFIDGREFDRIGLVVFAEDAYYQAPPTLDYNILKLSLQNVPLAGEVGLSNRTAIGLGLASSVNMLRSSEADSQVIILLTDGANNAGEIDPISAARIAATFGYRVYTIGMGTNEVAAENSLDEDTLREIADITDGRFYNALSLADLQNIYDQIDRIERSPIQRQLNIRWQDRAAIVLVFALILLLLERTLRHTLFQTIP
ncbi:MAG: VWA domain-containing protein [Anaerolineae bacterium]|nr:VWA domain-containing protein [Anaerolineae bacterium]MDQ7034591.1 VWA domain-containing protein [Anaerolineae bacterium]